MPVMYSLDVEENHNVETFWKGWVMDELIGMLILNARGLSRIVKGGSNPVSPGSPTKLDISGLA
jgi:hypothetical protein